MDYEEGIDKNWKNYNKNLIIYLILINIVLFISIKYYNKNTKNKNFSPYSPEITEIIIGEGNYAKIGIISDLQIDAKHGKPYNKYFEDNLLTSLKVLKKNNVDIIIIAGDITNSGKTIDYLLFNNIFYSIFEYNSSSPILITLMGNHDYYDRKYHIIGNQQKFYQYMKSYPYSHYIINNFNFIFWSNDEISKNKIRMEDYYWIKSTLEKARKNKNKEGDPIFVITHMHPKNTVYGSEEWGHDGIYDILKNYPEVISISGHSHYSLKNIKSIWQGNFTAINTQSLSYVDLDTFYTNTMKVRLDSAENDYMGLIAHLNQNNIIFDRIEFSTEEIMEEKWKIDFPINTSNFIYTFDKRNKKIKPIFKDNNGIRIEKKEENNDIKNYIVFNAAFHEDYVYIYKIVFKNKNFNREYLYYSDYYKNKKLRNEIVNFEIPNNLPKGKYNVQIYAIDSFDNISDPKNGEIDF